MGMSSVHVRVRAPNHMRKILHMSKQPLSESDRLLWQAVTKDVRPLHCAQVTPLPQPLQHAHHVKPRPTPGTTLDLHGATLAAAHEAALAHVDQSKTTHKHVTIITGKSGAMSTHMPTWLDHLPHVRQVDTLPGGGAFRVWLRKPKK